MERMMMVMNMNNQVHKRLSWVINNEVAFGQTKLHLQIPRQPEIKKLLMVLM